MDDYQRVLFIWEYLINASDQAEREFYEAVSFLGSKMNRNSSYIQDLYCKAVYFEIMRKVTSDLVRLLNL